MLMIDSLTSYLENAMLPLPVPLVSTIHDIIWLDLDTVNW